MAVAAGSLLDLSGRVALVTGGLGNIGRSIASRLEEAGARVAVQSRRESGDAKHVFASNLSDEGEVRGVLDRVEAALGPVDILVNNAAAQDLGSLHDLALSDWRAMQQTNLDAPFLLMQQVAQRLINTGRPGAMINIASIEALAPAPGHGHYATAKAALVMLTQAAALEFGRYGIRVNAVSPGLIHREGIEQAWPEGVARWRKSAPLGRLGQADDVADAVLFLASEASRWITGTNLVVDGGMMAGPGW